MNNKVLIEREVINKIIKYVEIHLDVLSNTQMEVINNKEKLINSIEYLKEIPKMLKPTEKELAELKRKAYWRYANAKKELEEEKLKGNNISEKSKEVENLLRYYIGLKEAYDIKNNKK